MYNSKKNVVISQYKNGKNLLYRKSIYDKCIPYFNINTETNKIISLLKPSSVLDIGCGTGDLLCELRLEYEFKGKLVGIDIAPSVMKTGIEINKSKKLDINFKVGDFDNLKFLSDKFDCIVIKHALHHATDIDLALEEVYGCLSDSGYLILVLNTLEDKKLRNYFFDQVIKNTKAEYQSINMEARYENILKYLKKFNIIDSIVFRSNIRFSEEFEYFKYLNSLRDSFIPMLSDRVWKNIIQKIFTDKLSMFKDSKGFINENIETVIVIAQKRNNIKSSPK